jgi:hypothetical protein
MRSRGHHAEFGRATFVTGNDGALEGRLQLENLVVEARVSPRGEASADPDDSGTQLIFQPGAEVRDVLVIAGAKARHRECTAEWWKTGDHPLARGAFVGPTYVTTYGVPLEGSAYRLRESRRLR